MMYVCYLRIFGMLQLTLGVSQLLYGSLRVAAGKTDSFGPPHFTLLVGGLIFIAGIISLIICHKANSFENGDSGVMQDIPCLMCAEMGLSVAACIGSFIGLFYVAIFGVQDCDPSEWTSHCNYTKNISKNRRTAVFILLFIAASVAVSITVICCNCRYGSDFGFSFNRRRGPLTVFGGTQPAQPQTTNPAINELQEQNRHLQDHIRLQQQQLELQHQLQQAGQGPPMTTHMYTPPPPSYEQCTSDEKTIRQLEDNYMEIQRHSQQQ